MNRNTFAARRGVLSTPPIERRAEPEPEPEPPDDEQIDPTEPEADDTPAVEPARLTRKRTNRPRRSK